jgi:AcrR family transcriptional regulator
VPKIVDPEQRRAAIADAVLAVVAAGGLEAASLRNVADQAGLAIGSVRHYFGGHDELIIFALGELNRRIGERVWAHAERIAVSDRADRRRLSEELLAEWLPVDETRRRESVLRYTFAVAARTRASLKDQAASLRETMAQIVRRVLSEARAAGGLAPGLDVEIEVARLCALLDGLSLQGVTGPADPGLLRAVLRRHLDEIGQA